DGYERSFGILALPQELDGEKRAARLHVGFPTASRTRRPDGVVAILPGADDRAVPHAPRDLPGQPTRRGDAPHIAVGIDRIHVDGAVRVRDRLDDLHISWMVEPGLVRVEIGFPPQPRLATLLGQQV